MVAYRFKDTLKEKWVDRIEEGEAELTEKGNQKHASYQLVAECGQTMPGKKSPQTTSSCKVPANVAI